VRVFPNEIAVATAVTIPSVADFEWEAEISMPTA
jgi:hypothetical protein